MTYQEWRKSEDGERLAGNAFANASYTTLNMNWFDIQKEIRKYYEEYKRSCNV